MNKVKRNLFIAITLIILLLLCLILSVTIAKNNKAAQESPSSISTAESTEEVSINSSISEVPEKEVDTEEDSLVATGPTGPTEIDEDPVYRVTITNRSDLYDTGIQGPAMDYIEPYLNEYFNYYLQDGNHYEAIYVEDSYIASYNIPRFNVYVEDLDLEIECMYIIDEQYYRFKSRFNPNGE